MVRPMKPTSKILKTDDEKRIAYGVVYEPGVPDSHGDFMVAEEIEKMAHKFLADGRVLSIDTEHDLENNGSVVVESFVVRKGDPDFPEGSWVLGVHIPGDDLWTAVKKGEIGGFSMYGKALREDDATEIVMELPDDGLLWGTTAECDGHTHQYVVKFDEDGNFLGGLTDDAAGHSHQISKGTVTEKDSDHRHRFNFLENVK